LHAGFNVQLQKFVVGVEGEVGGMGVDGSGQYAPFVGVRTPADSATAFHMDRYATIAGRLGFLATDRWLVYGKAGWGTVRTSVSFIDSDPAGTTLVSGTRARAQLSGMVWGGGLEYALSHWASVKLEYLRFDTGGTITHTALNNTAVPFRFAHHMDDLDTVKLGLSIKLDRARDAVPLK
jgi:outer membrane immunogenic protein